MPEYPQEVSTFKVVGRLVRRVDDGTVVPLKGATVLFSPNLNPPVFRVPGATTPLVVYPETVYAKTDEDGYLVEVEKTERGVILPWGFAPEITPTGWTWRVQVRVGGNIPHNTFSIDGSAGGVVDLASVVPVPDNITEALPSWLFLRDTVLDARDYVLDARSDVEQHAISASDSATSAAQSAVSASSSAEDSSDSATASASSALSASTSASQASDSATSASESAAAAAATNWGGTNIATGTNLDTVLQPGRYYFGSSTPDLTLNYPFSSGSGLMEVLKYSGTTQAVVQRVTYTSGTMGMQGVFTRRWLNSWGGWTFIPTLRVNNPGDQPGRTFSFLDGVGGASTEFTVPIVGMALNQADLNTVTLPGTYVQSTSSNGTLARNYPINLTYGVLEVVSLATSIQQRYTQSANSGSRGIYLRNRSTNGVDWSPWILVPAVRVNNPGDQPGAQYFMWNGTAEQLVEPTGISLGTADLNTVTLGGTYIQDTSANGTTARNYPVGPMTAVLEVTPITGGRVLQRIRRGLSGGTTGFYERTLWDGVWQPWRFFGYQRVDQTAGRAMYSYDDINSRDQLIYGDTGWRDITSLLLNGWTGVGTTVLIRRVGLIVHIKVEGLDPSAQTSQQAIIFPAGFRPGAGGAGNPNERMLLHTGSLGATTIYRTSINSTSGATGVVAPSNAGMLYGSITYSTTETWPTALPGTALGGVPTT